MTLDFSAIIDKLKTLEENFNGSDDPVERMAILNAVNHIAEHELKFDEKEWIYQGYYKASLEAFGAKVNYDTKADKR